MGRAGKISFHLMWTEAKRGRKKAKIRQNINTWGFLAFFKSIFTFYIFFTFFNEVLLFKNGKETEKIIKSGWRFTS